MCKSTSVTQACTTYVGCTGDSCPQGGCVNLSAAVATQSLRTISGQTSAGPLDIEVRVPVDVPLDVADVEYEQTKEGFKIQSYKVVNKGLSPIISVVANWTYIGQEPADQIKLSDLIDSWEMPDPLLAAGTTVTRTGTTVVHGPNVRKLVVEFAYVEFASGTLAGFTPNCTAGKLANSRKATLAAYKKLLGMYEAGVSSDELEQFVSKTPEFEWLRLTRLSGGMKAALDSAYRVVALRAGFSRAAGPPL